MQPLEKGSYKTVPGKYYDSPKELWGFRSERGKGSAPKIARVFLHANAAMFRLEKDLSGLVLQRTIFLV